MKKRYIATFILTVLMFSNVVFAQFDLGGDLVSRYVWRGTDFGNAASIQPYMSYTLGNLEIGAWASYPVFSDSTTCANENDLYISYSMGNFGITLTDYYFPEGLSLFDYGETGAHILEGTLSAEFGSFSALAAVNFLGDSDYSFYVEGGYGFYEKDDVSLSAVVGLGNAVYTLDGDVNLVNVGLSASKGSFSASFIVNPDTETDFLVIVYSF